VCRLGESINTRQPDIIPSLIPPVQAKNGHGEACWEESEAFRPPTRACEDKRGARLNNAVVGWGILVILLPPSPPTLR